MNRKNALFAAILFLCACSRLDNLTPETLAQAETLWHAANLSSYRLVIEMNGDRVEKEQFEVTVRDNQVVSTKRNGQEVKSAPGQDYSMNGLFRMLRQELDLAQKPVLLGAPEGYSAYPMARFDAQTGRLVEYRRTVGGTSNTINIRVLEFQQL